MIWPFQTKQQEITTDDAARVLSDEIRMSLEPYLETMDRHVVINNNLHELKYLVCELSIFHISLFYYTCSVIECTDDLRDKIIPMLVGYSRVEPKLYIERSKSYAEALSYIRAEMAPLTASNVLAEIIDGVYSGYKDPNGKILLADTFTALAFKSIKKLGTTMLELQRLYKIAG